MKNLRNTSDNKSNKERKNTSDKERKRKKTMWNHTGNGTIKELHNSKKQKKIRT